MNLHLGCAMPPFHPQHQRILAGKEWVHVDKYIKHPDVTNWDATTLEEVKDHSVETIYSSHLLEHIEHTKTLEVLKLWKRKMIAGGELILNVPDLTWLMHEVKRYEAGDVLSGYYYDWYGEHGLLSVLFGSQSHDGEYHKCAFTKRSLHDVLYNAGFRMMNIDQMVDAHDMGVLIARCYA